MKLLKYLIIGLIQGFTEPLPISSSAHMIFFSHYLGVEKMDLSFEVFVNFASTLAIFLFFWKDIQSLIIHTIKNDTTSSLNRTYTWKLILASSPAILVGLFFSDFIDQYFLNLFTCSVALILTSCMLGYACLMLKKKREVSKQKFQLHRQLQWDFFKELH